jgi:voltage-gated potassium channel Kch
MADSSSPSPTASRALDATRALSGLDPKLVPSVAATFASLSKTRLGEFDAVHNAMKAFELDARPIVAPQIAEAMKGIEVGLPARSFAEAMSGINRASTFNFARTLDDLGLGAVIQPQLGELVRTLELSIGATAADALRDLRTIQFVPSVERAAEEAVALADVADVADVVDEAVGRFEALTPANRRLLANDVAVLIGALLALAGLLVGSGNMRDAGASIALAAALVRVYWRLTGKLD